MNTALDGAASHRLGSRPDTSDHGRAEGGDADAESRASREVERAGPQWRGMMAWRRTARPAGGACAGGAFGEGNAKPSNSPLAHNYLPPYNPDASARWLANGAAL